MLKLPLFRESLGKSRWFCIWVFLCHLNSGFCFGQFYPSEPIIPESRLSSLTRLLDDHSTEIADRSHVLTDLANLYYNKPRKRYDDLDKAVGYAQMVIKLKKISRKSPDWQRATTLLALVAIDKNDLQLAEKLLLQLDGIARLDMKLRLAYAYCDTPKDFKNDDWARATVLAKDAITNSIQLSDPVRETQARQIIALVHAKQQDIAAENELLDIVERFKKAGSKNYQTTYTALSEYNFYMGDQSRALYYSLEAIKAMTASKDSGMAGDIYTNHAMILADNDEYNKGYNYIQLAIKHYGLRAGRYNLSDPVFLFKVEYILAKTDNYNRDLRQMRLLLSNAPPQNNTDRIYHNVILGRIYRQMKKYDKSEAYYRQAYDISARHKINMLRATAELAQLYTDVRQYAKARPLLYDEFKFPQSLMTNGDRLHLHLMTFLADSATGNCYDAMKHLSACSTLNDFNLKRARDREGQRLRITFEAQQREDEIKIKDRDIKLLNQNANIQEERVRNARLTTALALMVTIFMVVIAGLIFSKYRQKTRSSLEIEHKNTIITEKNQILEHLVNEKEWLLKEVHHRVKNNLHTIICLLESQASYLDNEAFKVLETSQNRIYAMSLIHQKLYQSEDIKTVDMKNYFTDFLKFLSETFGTSNRITIVHDIDPIKLPTTLAIPLALIVNESVTNAFKYAFPDNLKGVVQVLLHHENGELLLTVEDDGIGWDESTYDNQSSLGIQLMKGLGEDLGSQIVFENNGGTRVSLALQFEVNEKENIGSALFS